MKHLYPTLILVALTACVGDDGTVIDAGSDAAQDAPLDVHEASAPDVSFDVKEEPEASASFDGNTFGNLELWIRADDIEADGGQVQLWPDRSLQKRKVTATTPQICEVCSCYGPFVQQSAIHGLPIATFDGSTTCMNVDGSFTAFSLGFTAFIVFQPGSCGTTVGSSGGLFDSRANSTSYFDGIAIHRDAVPSNTASGDAMLSVSNSGGAGAAIITGGGSWVPATPELLEFRLPAASQNSLVSGLAYVNGLSSTLGENDPVIPLNDTARTLTTIGYFGGGGTSPLFCGGLGEMLIYSKGLAEPDRLAIEQYLKVRWGL